MYAYSRANPIEKEKLAINRIVMKHLRPQLVLEPFAGDGTSTSIFLRHTQQLIAIEKNPKCIAVFLSKFRSRKITLIANDNTRILPLFAARCFELIDLDPYGSCYDQIKLCARLLDPKGILLLSSGEIQRVVRGLRLSRFSNSRDYKGRKAVFWAERVWIPYVSNLLREHGCKVHLVHFFTSPVLVRVVFAGSKSSIDPQALIGRSRYLGWFRSASSTEEVSERLTECEYAKSRTSK